MLSRLAPPWTDPVEDVAVRNGAAIGGPYGQLLGMAQNPLVANEPGARERFYRDLDRVWQTGTDVAAAGEQQDRSDFDLAQRRFPGNFAALAPDYRSPRYVPPDPTGYMVRAIQRDAARDAYDRAAAVRARMPAA